MYREWRATMRRHGVDLVLSLPADAPKVAKTAAKQSAWLSTTRVPLRRITFEATGFLTDSHVVKQRRACEKLAVSKRMLATSRPTLKARNALIDMFLPGCQNMSPPRKCSPKAVNSCRKGCSAVYNA